MLWGKAFLDLRPSVSPCPGLTGANWAAIHENAVTFLDRWADEAVRLGWTTLDCFGVHPEAGTIRPDYCGAVIKRVCCRPLGAAVAEMPAGAV
jgi:hypothetical protein